MKMPPKIFDLIIFLIALTAILTWGLTRRSQQAWYADNWTPPNVHIWNGAKDVPLTNPMQSPGVPLSAITASEKQNSVLSVGPTAIVGRSAPFFPRSRWYASRSPDGTITIRDKDALHSAFKKAMRAHGLAWDIWCAAAPPDSDHPIMGAVRAKGHDVADNSVDSWSTYGKTPDEVEFLLIELISGPPTTRGRYCPPDVKGQ
jgi:hypothetical protein